MSTFRVAAVLGAGTMGAQIAAHFANVGLDVRLLDVSREEAAAGIARLKTLRPDPCFVPDAIERITPGGFDSDAALLRTADWIVEAVVESLEIKQQLLNRLAPEVPAAAVVSTNTSGIPIAAIAAGLPETLRRRWLGTHFFNPPRYLRLLELIPSPDTESGVIERVADFADRRLGKGVVIAKDSPGFIANRIGVYGALRAVELVESGEFTIEEVDAITGPAIGWPKSATFRTLDISGIDIFSKVASDLSARLAAGAQSYLVPPLIRSMVERSLLGVKTGAGFYKRVKSDGESEILVLDPATLDFRSTRPVQLPALDAARSIEDPGARLKMLLTRRDRAGDYLRRTLGATVRYAAEVAPDVAHSPADIDRAMRLGFGWTLGPFEIIDAAGADAVGITDDKVPDSKSRASALDRGQRLTLAAARTSHGVVRANAGASVVDLGDGVLCVEFHSKLNTLGGDAIAMLQAGIAEAAAHHQALVIANDSDTFSAGANIMLVLLEAQEGNWDEIDAMVRAFQAMTMAIKTSPVPVVAAPAGLALGGGCEICLHAPHVRAAAETYMGLVEAGVGLLPAGGGTKEMLLRAVDRAGRADASPFVQAAFETIGFGKVSTSAPDARRLGYLREPDGMTMNRDRLIDDARRDALAMAAAGFQPQTPRTSIPVGGADLYATLTLGLHLAHRAGRLTDHETMIGKAIARVLVGGDIPHRSAISEQALLDLEREAFLRLCGERKTLERMAYTLKTGKTLRN